MRHQHLSFPASDLIIYRGETKQIDRKASIIKILSRYPGLRACDIADKIYNRLLSISWSDVYRVLKDMTDQNILARSGNYYYLMNDALSHDMAVTEKTAKDLESIGVNLDQANFLAGGLVMVSEKAKKESEGSDYDVRKTLAINSPVFEQNSSYDEFDGYDEFDEDSEHSDAMNSMVDELYSQEFKSLATWFNPVSNIEDRKLLHDWFNNNYDESHSFLYTDNNIQVYNSDGFNTIYFADIIDDIKPVPEEELSEMETEESTEINDESFEMELSPEDDLVSLSETQTVKSSVAPVSTDETEVIDNARQIVSEGDLTPVITGVRDFIGKRLSLKDDPSVIIHIFYAGLNSDNEPVYSGAVVDSNNSNFPIGYVLVSDFRNNKLVLI